MNREFVNKIINITISLFLFIMCLDLLYLYSIGAWFDSVKLMEYSEVVLLFTIGVFSFYWFIILVKRFINEH